jgi:hypothetical protein
MTVQLMEEQRNGRQGIASLGKREESTIEEKKISFRK